MHIYYIILVFASAFGGYFAYGRPHSISWLAAAVTNMFLAGFVYSNGRQIKINRAFAILCFCVALWTLSVFGLYIITDEHGAGHWIRFLRPGYFFLAPSIFYFMLALAKSDTGKNIRLVYVSFTIAAALSLLNYTGFFDEGIVSRGLSYFPKIGKRYIATLVNLGFWGGWGLFFIFRAYGRLASVRERQQLKYFFAGSSIALFLGLVSNTLFGLGHSVYPMGGIGIILYALIVSYAIIKHQLMDIEVIIRKGIIYAALTLSVIGVYAITVGISAGILGTRAGNWFTNALGGIVIALIFLPLRSRIQLAVDKLFFKDKYDYHKTLSDFSRDITSILDLELLFRLLVNNVTETMHIFRGCIMIYNPDRATYETRYCTGKDEEILRFELREADAPVEWLNKHASALNLAAHEESSFPQLRDRGIMLVIPLINKKRLVGMMNFGAKLSEDAYTSEDIELLMTLSGQAAIAIENDQLSARMRELEKSLHQADKLSALGTFASSLAHEIKNPLSSIKTFSQLMEKRFNDTVFREKFSAIVPQEIDRLEAVLNQLVDFGKESSLDFEPVKIGKVIDELFELVQYEALRRNIKVIKECGASLPPVAAVEQQLKQVFMNLILNAIQAMPAGGEVRISAAAAADDRIGDIVRVSVKDNGSGIPPEAMARIFKPFFTTKADGTGLGLSITQRIVRDHGGAIEVNSEPGNGAEFIVKLPVFAVAQP